MLWSTDEYGAAGTIVSAGDYDGDGIFDLRLRVETEVGYGNSLLFLSKGASPGQRRLAAKSSQVDELFAIADRERPDRLQEIGTDLATVRGKAVKAQRLIAGMKKCLNDGSGCLGYFWSKVEIVDDGDGRTVGWCRGPGTYTSTELQSCILANPKNRLRTFLQEIFSSPNVEILTNQILDGAAGNMANVKVHEEPGGYTIEKLSYETGC